MTNHPNIASIFNPAYRVARCGQLSSHGPHVMEHGPDQPRNCPGNDGTKSIFDSITESDLARAYGSEEATR